MLRGLFLAVRPRRRCSCSRSRAASAATSSGSPTTGRRPLLLLAYAVRPQSMRRSAIVVLTVAVVAQAVPIVRTLHGGLQERADSAASGAAPCSSCRPTPTRTTASRWSRRGATGRATTSRRATSRSRAAGSGRTTSRSTCRSTTAPSTREVYHRWISSLAVGYVVLPRDELDYSSRKEAEMLALGHGALPWLKFVHRDPNVDIYQVLEPTPTADAGPGHRADGDGVRRAGRDPVRRDVARAVAAERRRLRPARPLHAVLEGERPDRHLRRAGTATA